MSRLVSLVTLLSVFGFVLGTKCNMYPSYPPPSDHIIGWQTIDLDLPPQERWEAVVTKFNSSIHHLMDVFLAHNSSGDLIDYIRGQENNILARFPNDIGDEIRGIAEITKIEIALLIIYNIAYELVGLCTSIVAQNETGHVFHGRNLDFGLSRSWNWTEDQWELTDALRPTLFNAILTKGGQEWYRGTFYAGYVGVLTGFKKEAFSVTVDTRFDDHFDEYLIAWFADQNDNSQFLGFMMRDLLETQPSYKNATSKLIATKMIGPCYAILGGYRANEGGVITIGPDGTLEDLWEIPNALPANSTSKWYVLETNYNHWDNPPFFDDRRYPAEDCMNELGTTGISKANLFNVLNALPNRNRLTTYTALIDVSEGTLESYYQYCDEIECIPW